MQQKTYHKFDICDKTWEKIEPHLMGRRGKMVEQPKAIESVSVQLYGTKNRGDMAKLTS